MLRIIYGECNFENYIFDPDTFFDHVYEDEWIIDELSVEMIKDVDKSEVIGAHSISSPYLGSIPVEKLSGGVKTLILMNNDVDHIFNASACGDNCAKWILEIAKSKDITIRLGYLMDFGNDDFGILIENTGRVVHNFEELDEEVIDNRLLQV